MSVNSSAGIAGTPASLVSDWRSAASLIDHTLLKPEATRDDVAALCDEGLRYGFHSVVVHPTHVSFAAARVRGTSLRVGTVVGFPLGAHLTVTKLAEAEAVLRVGAQEVDAVLNIAALKSRDRALVQTEMRGLAQLAHDRGALLKVILENALLTQEEKILACALAVDAGVDFVKTSTGWAASGATVADVALMRGVVGLNVGVKAAGGIRSSAQLLDMVDAGANRIGASASVEIVRAMGAPEQT
jgi:deoxyribose-phosphate aldolase